MTFNLSDSVEWTNKLGRVHHIYKFNFVFIFASVVRRVPGVFLCLITPIRVCRHTWWQVQIHAHAAPRQLQPAGHRPSCPGWGPRSSSSLWRHLAPRHLSPHVSERAERTGEDETPAVYMDKKAGEEGESALWQSSKTMQSSRDCFSCEHAKICLNETHWPSAHTGTVSNDTLLRAR